MKRGDRITIGKQEYQFADDPFIENIDTKNGKLVANVSCWMDPIRKKTNKPVPAARIKINFELKQTNLP